VRAALAIAAILLSTAAFAQSPSKPGPYIIDLRGTMSGVPSASAFHAGLPPGALVPKRGFGIGGGGHVYLFNFGPARVGVGIDVSSARGTSTTPAGLATGSTTTTTTPTTTPTQTPATPTLTAASAIKVATTITIVAPQVSFNFGSRDGWSYLSAGYGAAHIRSESSGTLAAPFTGTATLLRDAGRARAINYGGGARWFVREHLAVGFDLRFHRIAANGVQPSAKAFVLSAGVSLR
jgi:hypothetical protein